MATKNFNDFTWVHSGTWTGDVTVTDTTITQDYSSTGNSVHSRSDPEPGHITLLDFTTFNTGGGYGGTIYLNVWYTNPNDDADFFVAFGVAVHHYFNYTDIYVNGTSIRIAYNSDSNRFRMEANLDTNTVQFTAWDGTIQEYQQTHNMASEDLEVYSSSRLDVYSANVTNRSFDYIFTLNEYLRIDKLPPPPVYTAGIDYNGNANYIDVFYPIDSSLNLGLIPMVDSVGLIKYRTIPSAQTISNKRLVFRSYSDQIYLDQYISGENYRVTGASPALTTDGPVFPFGPLYDFSEGKTVAFELENEGHADFYGNITSYKMTKLAPVDALVDNDFSGETSCTSEDWTLNGVGLPFPEDGKFKPKIAGSIEVTQSHGGYSDIQGVARTQGDTTSITVSCDKVKAFELLDMFRSTVWSSGTVTAVFNPTYKPFGTHRANTCEVMITTPKIEVSQTGAQTYIIKFGLQYQGV